MRPETDAKQDGRPARLENLTLWQRVYEYLREEILAERLQPGAELLEVPLSEELGVSRGPIREAIEMMAVRLAVPKLGPDDFGRLQELIDAMSAHAERDEVAEFFRANVA